MLAEVDLEYLVDRDGAMTEETHWEDVLSLGEKQRLAIARLVYHKPRFAILDECSSAITSEMERRLYRICQENSITYITIAHRPVLRAYHDVSLSIGDGKQGWKVEAINRTAVNAKALEMAKASLVSKADEESQKEMLGRRSAPYEHLISKKAMPAGTTIPRLLRLCKLAVPDFWVAKGLAILGLIIGQTAIEDFVFGNTGRMYGCLMRRDARGMVGLFRNGVIAAVLQSVIWETMLWCDLFCSPLLPAACTAPAPRPPRLRCSQPWRHRVQRETGADCAAKVENNLIDRWMSNNYFYQVAHVDCR